MAGLQPLRIRRASRPPPALADLGSRSVSSRFFFSFISCPAPCPVDNPHSMLILSCKPLARLHNVRSDTPFEIVLILPGRQVFLPGLRNPRQSRYSPPIIGNHRQRHLFLPPHRSMHAVVQCSNCEAPRIFCPTAFPSHVGWVGGRTISAHFLGLHYTKQGTYLTLTRAAAGGPPTHRTHCVGCGCRTEKKECRIVR